MAAYLQKAKSLTMQEITHLFYQMVIVGAEYQQKKTYHERICPETIFVEQKNAFKILKVDNQMGVI